MKKVTMPLTKVNIAYNPNAPQNLASSDKACKIHAYDNLFAT